MDKTAARQETVAQKAQGSALPSSKREGAQQQLSTATKETKPATAKVKVKPLTKVAAQKKTQLPKASHNAATKRASTTPASQQGSSNNATPPPSHKPGPNRNAATEAKRDVKVSPTTQFSPKPPADRKNLAAITKTAETPESMEEQQKLVMLTRQQTTPEAVNIDPPTPQHVVLDLAALPLSFGAHWSLDRRPNPINHKTQCLLTSRSLNISDGYDRTDVQLLLTAKSLYVKTASNIDLSYPDSGIRLDDGTLLPFKSLAKETAAMISGDVESLYRQMAPNQTLLVRLGFWPTWPVTETQQANFPLDGFSDAVKALWQCEKM